MPKKENAPTQRTENEIMLPQEIIDSFARFLVPEIRKYYNSEQGRQKSTS